jgi:hypothetical protein
MLDSVKKLFEAVDSLQKFWSGVVLIGTTVLPIIGPRLGIQSPTLAFYIAGGAALGGVFGYCWTVFKNAGKGKERCKRQICWNFRWAFLPLIILVAMLCVLRPEAERYVGFAGKVREFLSDLPLLPNLGSCLFALWHLARIIGAITLMYSKLWNVI